jgi:hypothetical protein
MCRWTPESGGTESHNAPIAYKEQVHTTLELTTFMQWLYFGLVLLGISIHEIACCTYFIVSMILEKPGQLKFPLFWACILTNVSSIVGISTLTNIAYWRFSNLIKPQTLEQMNIWMIPASLIGGFAAALMVFGLAMVIFLRTIKIYQHQSHWFKYYTYVMTFILTIGAAGSVITVPFVFSYGIQYPSAPLYKYYIIFGGMFLNFPASLHMVIAAFVFLRMLYSAKGYTYSQFLLDWFLRQDGFRYIIILALNMFNIYCFVISAIYGQNDVTILMFYSTYWVVSAALMTFMENSYVTTKAVMNSDGTRTASQMQKSLHNPTNVFMNSSSTFV